jgi:catechol 2,3-dioxygenase-like lactoylglutathione lyase family enzyme
MNPQSAVEFNTPTRIHMGLTVRDLERSIAFYRSLFAQEPTKVRPHYAKFEVTDPPVNLALNEDPEQKILPSRVSHFGIQVKSAEAVAQAAVRLQAAGLKTTLEDSVTCCYAVQDKAWVTDPDGNAWEVFVVLDADAQEYIKNTASSCCTGKETAQPSTSSTAEACCS